MRLDDQRAIFEPCRLDHLLDQGVHLEDLGHHDRCGFAARFVELSEQPALQHRCISADDRQWSAELVGCKVQELALVLLDGGDALGHAGALQPGRDRRGISRELSDLVGPEKRCERTADHAQVSGTVRQAERQDQDRPAVRRGRGALPGGGLTLHDLVHRFVIDPVAGEGPPAGADDERRLGAQHPFGHEVLEAALGLAALDVIGDVAPDLVIADLRMPRMGGLELIREMRASPEMESIPVVLPTGHVDVADVKRSADAVMIKPFDPEDLVATVSNLVGPKRAGV